jgi:hypothetical protein
VEFYETAYPWLDTAPHLGAKQLFYHGETAGDISASCKMDEVVASISG